MRVLTILLTASIAAAAPGAALAAPADVAAAVAAAGRTADNVKLDEGLKPAKLLSFVEREQGMQVVDMLLVVVDPKVRGDTDPFIFNFREATA